MGWIDTLIPAAGLLLCLTVLVALCHVVLRAYRLAALNAAEFSRWQAYHRQRFDGLRKPGVESTDEPEAWNGYRQFRVANLEPETDDAVSITLVATDGKPIIGFKPGQYLTLRLNLANQEKPATRCYSFSDAFSGDSYRITVKQKTVPPEFIDKSVSHYLNEQLSVGDIVSLKRPAGDFYLNLADSTPLVLLAAGVGITPMFSIIQTLRQNNDQRQVILFYGNRNSRSHIFKEELTALANDPGNVFVINCYSCPLPNDQAGVDFHTASPVTIELIQQLLPNQKFSFFLCGPVGFMQSLYTGLKAWGVPESRIHYEAFGPATVEKNRRQMEPTEQPSSANLLAKATSNRVAFRSGDQKAAEGEDVLGTVLEIAEELNLELASGCRSGNCGTCAVRLVRGQVQYPGQACPDVEPGYCLACVATPVGDVEIEI